MRVGARDSSAAGLQSASGCGQQTWTSWPRGALQREDSGITALGGHLCRCKRFSLSPFEETAAPGRTQEAEGGTSCGRGEGGGGGARVRGGRPRTSLLPDPAGLTVSSATSHPAGAVMRQWCPAVGSSAFSSPVGGVKCLRAGGGVRWAPPDTPTHPRWCGPWPGTHLVFAVEQGFLSNLGCGGQVRVGRADGRGLQGSKRQLRRLSWGPCQPPSPTRGPSCSPLPPRTRASRPSRTLVVKHEAAAVKEIGEQLAQVVVIPASQRSLEAPHVAQIGGHLLCGAPTGLVEARGKEHWAEVCRARGGVHGDDSHLGSSHKAPRWA